MEFHLCFFVFIYVALVVVSHAALPSEVYWHSVLPNTPMPQAIQDLLPEGKGVSTEDSGVGVGVGGGGVSVGVGGKGGGGGGGVSVGVGSKGRGGGGGGVSVGVGRKGGGGVSVGPGHKRGPHVRVKPPFTGAFNYEYAASKDQLKDDPNVALFFLEKDLHPATKMNLHFTKTTSRGQILPRQVANSIPFSSHKFSDILNRFSIEPQSEEAQLMKTTIEECEKPAMEGEDRICTTSIEEMIDFSTLKLGKDVQAVSTEVDKEESREQEFSISERVKKMGGDKTVACHGLNYVYPVFYCHAMQATRAYLVPLIGADGTKVKAVAVCHTNTSNWNPKHLAFQVLGVKPGTLPICHFLPEDHIIWA